MISLDTAKALRDAGLIWQPALHDYFAIPDRDMDDMVFVISDIQVTVDMIQGLKVVSFQGASEWALDALVTSEVIWLPRESQLRRALEAALLETGDLELNLTCGLSGCICRIRFRGQRHSFGAKEACDAYAAALLHVLRERSGEEDALA